MKKILVPCDFSNTAVQAFRFACEMASRSKGEVFLLNVVEFPVLFDTAFVPVHGYESAFLKGLKEKVNKNFERIKEKWSGKVKVHLSMEKGLVIDTIRKFVDKKRIDLIIMGTHGASGFREYAFGSNTEKIVRSSKVPVIAVKKATPVSSLKHIIFPTDLASEQQNLVPLVKVLQSFFKAKLHILFVNTPANFTRDATTEKRLGEFAKKHQFKNYTLNIYNDMDKESGIIDFSMPFRNKLIAMSTHSRKGLSHLLTGSIAEDVVNHIDCPIWTVGR